MDIYIRVSDSRDKQGTDAYMAEDLQLDKALALVRLSDGMTVGDVIRDIDHSGSTMDRPGFQKIMGRIHRGERQGIVVARLDRFGRMAGPILSTVAEIQKAGGEVLSAEEKFDTSSSTGQVMLGFLAVMAQFQLDRIREGWAAVHARNVTAGVPNGVPFGYRRGEDRTLEPDVLSPLVPQAFARRGHGDSLRHIADFLNASGAVTTKGGQWTSAAVGSMLKNRAYLGEVHYGKLVNDSAHEALVDTDIWHRAQTARPSRARMNGGGLLSGLLRCASCQYALGYRVSKTQAPHYGCPTKTASGTCPAPVFIQAEAIDAYVMEWMRGRLEGWSVEAIADERGDLLQALDNARNEFSLYREQRSLIRVLGAAEYERELTIYADAVTAAEAKVAAAKIAPPSFQEWQDLPMDEKRLTLRNEIDCLFLRGRPGSGAAIDLTDRVHICPLGQGPDELPSRGPRERTIRPFVFPDGNHAHASLA